jgi:hypothetical protein
MFLLRELYEQEQYHPENNNYHLGVPGNDWPHIAASRPDMEKGHVLIRHFLTLVSRA